MKHWIFRAIGPLLALILFAPGAALAQLRIDVSGVGATQIPIAVANFVTDVELPLDVVAVVRSDLVRSGAFRMVETGETLSETATPDFAALRGRGADTVLGGSIARLADGRFDIRFRLYDAVRQNPLGGLSLNPSAADLRYAAHRIADFIYEKLTGEQGVFSTRIAFVNKQGARYRLSVADWDGENVQIALDSPEPIISPAWAPDGTRLAYVSFERKKPVIFVQSLSTQQRSVLADFKGSNSAPAWAPDGRRLAVVLTREGLSQLFLINADGSGLQRVASSPGIDTEPAFTPDGQTIYFTSDRGGTPQIYRIPVTGGPVTRVTLSGSYNVSPRISADGRSLAYISRRDGRFLVAVRDLTTGVEQVVSDTGRDESPSFAPNGRWILYATRGEDRDVLIAVTVDGRVKQRLSSPAADIREPAWGPYAQ
ncbi:MAG: Tol-Pal system protein TolB [Burkholderiales bacterium]|nr:MAG: Tol-Pal system protein TolB [Burkholderiales bacterium]